MAFDQAPAPCWEDSSTVTTSFSGTTGLNTAEVRLAPDPNRLVATPNGLWTNPAPHKRFITATPVSWSAIPSSISGSTVPTQSVSLTIPANPFGLASIPAAPHNRYVMEVTALLPAVNIPVDNTRFYYEWTITQGASVYGPLRIWLGYPYGQPGYPYGQGSGYFYGGEAVPLAYIPWPTFDMSLSCSISLSGFCVMPGTAVTAPVFYSNQALTQAHFGLIADLSHEA